MTEETKEMTTGKRVTVSVPKVDLYETPDAVCLLAELPGVSEENIAVDLQGNTLTLRGVTAFTPPDGLTLRCSEYPPERVYERQFTLGDTIDQDAISATLKDGILHLTLPVIRERTARKIAVKTA